MFLMGADWIYGIAAVMLFGTVALQATPEGTYQKYVRLFLGALLMLAVLSPLFSLFGLGEMTRLSFERNVLTAWLDGSSLDLEEWQAAVRQKQETWLREPLDALAQEYGFVCKDYSVEWNEEGDWPEQLTLWVTKMETEKDVEGSDMAVDLRGEEMSSDLSGYIEAEGITSISSVDAVRQVGQDADAMSEGETATKDTYYEPSELRSLHQALQTVWQLREEQIVLYWER